MGGSYSSSFGFSNPSSAPTPSSGSSAPTPSSGSSASSASTRPMAPPHPHTTPPPGFRSSSSSDHFTRSSHPPGTVFYDYRRGCFIGTDPTVCTTSASSVGSSSSGASIPSNHRSSSAFGFSNPSFAPTPSFGSAASSASAPSFSLSPSDSDRDRDTPSNHRSSSSSFTSNPSFGSAASSASAPSFSSTPSAATSAPSIFVSSTSTLVFGSFSSSYPPTSSSASSLFGATVSAASSPLIGSSSSSTVSASTAPPSSSPLSTSSSSSSTPSTTVSATTKASMPASCSSVAQPTTTPLPVLLSGSSASVPATMAIGSSTSTVHSSNVSTAVSTAPKLSSELYSPTLEAEILGSLKGLKDLVAAATAATSTTTETLTNETKSIVEGFLEKDYACYANHEGERIKLRTAVQALIKDKFFPPVVGSILQGILDQLENGVSAFQGARTKFFDDQVLAGQIESSSYALQSKISACDQKKREFQELEVEKQRIEAEQARVLAEIEGIVEDTHPLQAQLQQFIQQRAAFSDENGGYKAIIVIEEELWGSFKNVLHKYFAL